MSDTPEFSHPFDIRGISSQPVLLCAGEAARAALAKRFDIVSIDRLSAELSLEADGAVVTAKGTIAAAIVQSCAVSGEDLPAVIHEAVNMRFVPGKALEASEENEEIEVDAEDLDDIPYHGTSFDLGEAVAQSLALAIDPFATGPQADEARDRHGLADEGPKGPFAEALMGLKKG